MIHEAYMVSEIAKRYFKEKGEELERKDAFNRWRMVRNPDKDVLKKIFSEIYKEQKSNLKK